MASGSAPQRIPTIDSIAKTTRSRVQNVVQSSSYLHRYGNFNDKTGNFIGADSSQDDGSGFTAPVGSYLPNPMIPGPRFSRSLAAPRRATAQPAHPAQDG